MIRLLLIVVLMLAMISPVMAQVSPPPVPTPDLSRVDELLEDGDSILQDAPAELPDVPDASGSSQVFGYTKWLLSPTSTQEIFGPVAPVVDRVGLFVVLTIIMGSIYGIIYAAMYLITFAVWFFKLAMTILNTVANWIEALWPL